MVIGDLGVSIKRYGASENIVRGRLKNEPSTHEKQENETGRGWMGAVFTIIILLLLLLLHLLVYASSTTRHPHPVYHSLVVSEIAEILGDGIHGAESNDGESE